MAWLDVRAWNLGSAIACTVACASEPGAASSSSTTVVNDDDLDGDYDCSTYCGDSYGPGAECEFDDECRAGQLCEASECVLDPALAVPACASPSITFGEPTLLEPGSFASIGLVAQADAVDVVVADYEGELRVLGEPATTFALENGVNEIEAADLDQDGDRDFVAFTSTKLLAYVHADGVFTEGPITDLSTGGAIWVTLADIDGDAFPDAVLDDFMTLVVREGVGDGSFGAPETVVYEPVCGLAGREVGGGVAFGRLDAAIFVDAGDPLSSWSLAKLVAPVAVYSPCASAFGDFDGNGVVDLFIAQDSLQGLATRWDGVRDSPTADAWSMPSDGDLAIAADLDGDGDDEAITRYEGVLMFRDVATAESPAGCIAAIDRPLGQDAAVYAIDDLDANGRADVVGLGPEGVVVAYANE